MTTCAFVMEDWPLTPNASGASALIYSHLQLMVHAVDRVELILIKNPNHSLGFDAYCQSQPEVWDEVRYWCAGVHFIENKKIQNSISTFVSIFQTVLDPAYYLYGALFQGSLSGDMNALLKKLTPDIIWAEHLFPASLLHSLKMDIRLVYSHHDWRWKIKSHRAAGKVSNIRQSLNRWMSKRHEKRIVREVDGCISGSQTELIEISALGVNRLKYFPATYDAIDISKLDISDKKPRIVHLGGMQATANRFGLLRFLKVCWPQLKNSYSFAIELWVVGSLEGATSELHTALGQENIICTGMVPDLSTVLRPFDIHIIPWEYNTGTRTRIPLVLNYAQVLVSTRAAASCLSELRHGENSILVQHLAEMTTAILDLFDKSNLRQKIGYHGRETFMKYFTRESQQVDFSRFVQDILSLSQKNSDTNVLNFSQK